MGQGRTNQCVTQYTRPRIPQITSSLLIYAAMKNEQIFCLDYPTNFFFKICLSILARSDILKSEKRSYKDREHTYCLNDNGAVDFFPSADLYLQKFLSRLYNSTTPTGLSFFKIKNTLVLTCVRVSLYE